MKIPVQLFMAVGKLLNGEENYTYAASKEAAILMLKEQSWNIVSIKVYVYNLAS